MARETRIKKSQRKEVTQQDVFEYGPSIEPAARPVDYDTRVVAKNTKGGAAQALLDGLGLTGDLVGNYYQAKKVIDANQQAEGKVAGARGDKLNADATEAFIKGHEMASGMAAVSEFQQEAFKKHTELLANEATPEEYEREMAGLERQALAAQSDAYTEGAVRGGMLEVNKKLSMQYAQAQVKRLQAKGLYNINGIIDTKLAEIMAMPTETDQQKTIQAVAARNLMTSMQELGMQQYNLNRNQVNASVAKHLAPIAQAQGNPHLFAYAFVDDGTGNKIINTEAGDEIYKAMTVAENQRKADIKSAAAAKEKADKKRVEDAQKQMLIALTTGERENVIAATQNLAGLTDIMPPKVLEDTIKAVQDFDSGFGYAQVGDMKTYFELKEGAVDGSVDFAELNENRDLIEKGQFVEVLNKIVAYKEKERTKAAGKADPRKAEIDRSRSALKQTLDVMSSMGKRREPVAGPERALQGMMFYDDIIKQFAANELKWLPNPSKRQFPNYEEHQKLIRKTQFEMYERVPFKGRGAPKYIDPETDDNTHTVKPGKVRWDDLPDTH
jgi:succinate dehydrogenase flavin-adding protein (antitoxin of CptAB toxin-antitoxin module)